jgi:hypothetical protein
MTGYINNPHKNVSYNLDTHLEQLLVENEYVLLNFGKEVEDNYLRFVNEILEKRGGQLILNFYSYNGLWTNLEFLSLLPNIKRLRISEDKVEHVGRIKNIEGLKELSLGVPNKVLKLNEVLPINLENLQIEGQHKNLDYLTNLEKLTSLSIWNYNRALLPTLSELNNLEDLFLHNVKDIYAISCIEGWGLKSLTLSRLKLLSDLNPIDTLKNLEHLSLKNLKMVAKLPKFTKLQKLRKLSLEKLSEIKTLGRIDLLKELKELYIYQCENVNKNELEIIRALNLEELRIE